MRPPLGRGLALRLHLRTTPDDPALDDGPDRATRIAVREGSAPVADQALSPFRFPKLIAAALARPRLNPRSERTAPLRSPPDRTQTGLSGRGRTIGGSAGPLKQVGLWRQAIPLMEGHSRRQAWLTAQIQDCGLAPAGRAIPAQKGSPTPVAIDEASDIRFGRRQSRWRRPEPGLTRRDCQVQGFAPAVAPSRQGSSRWGKRPARSGARAPRDRSCGRCFP